jgi:2',3'-cyclic-nucleotide 2'-phosphodiesterase (5'-nucleotidase family)
MLDAGDAFYDGYGGDEAKLKTVNATARFIVNEYNRSKLAGLVLGDRDFKLGAAALKKLHKKAQFPFLVANLVKAGTKKPVFEDRMIQTIDGVRIGVFGVTGDERVELDPKDGWQLIEPLASAREQVVALKRDGAELIIAVTHLRATLDQKLAQSLKDVNVVLSGGNMKMVRHPVQEGNTYIAGAYTKGKYVSVLTLYMQEGTKAPYTFLDRFKKTGLANKIRQVEARISTYSRMLEKRRKEADSESTKNPAGNQARIKRGGVQYYETQLVKLRSEKQLVQAELEAAAATDPNADFIHYELTALDKTIVHDEAVEKAVVSFRKAHPKPKPTAGIYPSQRATSANPRGKTNLGAPTSTRTLSPTRPSRRLPKGSQP